MGMSYRAANATTLIYMHFVSCILQIKRPQNTYYCVVLDREKYEVLDTLLERG